MIRAVRAELVKILRRRVLLVTALAVVVSAVGGAAIVLSAAEPARTATPGRGVTLEALADAGGGTEVFRTAASFSGFFVFVVFVAAVAVEFGRGTFRTMLLRQPRRLHLLAGKMAGLIGFAAGVLLVTEILTWIAARTLAPGQDVATDAWVTWAGLGQGVADYGAVVFWVVGYAVLGMALAIVTRSVAVALGIGIAWAGPAEHLLAESSDTANRAFPGLLLEAFAAGGTPDVTEGRALVTITAYLLVAAALGALFFARRDAVA